MYQTFAQNKNYANCCTKQQISARTEYQIQSIIQSSGERVWIVSSPDHTGGARGVATRLLDLCDQRLVRKATPLGCGFPN